MADLWTTNLGRVPYGDGVALQERLRAARQVDAVPDSLLLLEHPPVYTRGPRSGADELPLGDDWYAGRGIEIHDTDRGGHVTYHGPGQLVGYPIVRIDSVRGFVATLEDAIVAALADEGVPAGVRDGLTGVWVGERKIASLGLHVSRRVSTHGFAVNVDNDLDPFEWIVPCGEAGTRMTSVRAETGRDGASLSCFRRRMAWRLAEALGLRQRLVSAQRLHEAAVLATAASHTAGAPGAARSPAERAGGDTRGADAVANGPVGDEDPAAAGAPVASTGR